jgi:hypothetical protein
LREFCDQQGITAKLTSEDRRLILHDFQKAYLQHAKAALDHNTSYSRFELEDAPSVIHRNAVMPLPAADRLDEVAGRHIAEGKRANLWVAKTLTEKSDALNLLAQLTKNKPIRDVTKADARSVKSALQKLPKNRNKSPATKGLSCLTVRRHIKWDIRAV